MVKTQAPVCVCGKRGKSYFKSRSQGYLIDFDKIGDGERSCNAQRAQWVCCDDCRKQLLFPVNHKRLHDLVQFMVTRHAVTLKREELNGTSNELWRTVSKECQTAGIDDAFVQGLKWAYETGAQSIYSIIPERDPCPQL